MERTTYPDARPGLPPLVFDDEQQRRQVLASISEATACAEASLSISEYVEMTQSQLAKLRIEQKMATQAPSLETIASFMGTLTTFVTSPR